MEGCSGGGGERVYGCMAVARQRHDNDRACESVSVGGEAPAEHTDSDTHTQREREHIEHTRSVCGRVPKDIVQRALSKCQRVKAGECQRT